MGQVAGLGRPSRGASACAAKLARIAVRGEGVVEASAGAAAKRHVRPARFRTRQLACAVSDHLGGAVSLLSRRTGAAEVAS